MHLGLTAEGSAASTAADESGSGPTSTLAVKEEAMGTYSEVSNGQMSMLRAKEETMGPFSEVGPGQMPMMRVIKEEARGPYSEASNGQMSMLRAKEESMSMFSEVGPGQMPMMRVIKDESMGPYSEVPAPVMITSEHLVEDAWGEFYFNRDERLLVRRALPRDPFLCPMLCLGLDSPESVDRFPSCTRGRGSGKYYRGRGRPRKYKKEGYVPVSHSGRGRGSGEAPRGRGRPRKYHRLYEGADRLNPADLVYSDRPEGRSLAVRRGAPSRPPSNSDVDEEEEEEERSRSRSVDEDPRYDERDTGGSPGVRPRHRLRHGSNPAASRRLASTQAARRHTPSAPSEVRPLRYQRRMAMRSRSNSPPVGPRSERAKEAELKSLRATIAAQGKEIEKLKERMEASQAPPQEDDDDDEDEDYEELGQTRVSRRRPELELEPDSEESPAPKRKVRAPLAGAARGRGRPRKYPVPHVARDTPRGPAWQPMPSVPPPRAPSIQVSPPVAAAAVGGRCAASAAAQMARPIAGAPAPLTQSEKNELQEKIDKLDNNQLDRVLHFLEPDLGENPDGDVQLDLENLPPQRQRALVEVVEGELRAAAGIGVAPTLASPAFPVVEPGATPFPVVSPQPATPRGERTAADAPAIQRIWEECSVREAQRQAHLREVRELASASGSTPGLSAGAEETASATRGTATSAAAVAFAPPPAVGSGAAGGPASAAGVATNGATRPAVDMALMAPPASGPRSGLGNGAAVALEAPAVKEGDSMLESTDDVLDMM